jgi:hypothetical protein
MSKKRWEIHRGSERNGFVALWIVSIEGDNPMNAVHGHTEAICSVPIKYHAWFIRWLEEMIKNKTFYSLDKSIPWLHPDHSKPFDLTKEQWKAVMESDPFDQ